MIKTIEVTVPDDIYIEAALKLYDSRQLMQELLEREVNPSEYREMFAVQYAKEQIADARTDA